MQFEGKNVLITGAAVRVGRAMALAVAEAGANVIAHYGSSQAEAQQTKREIEDLGVNCHLLQADFSQPEKLRGLIEEAEQYGPLFGLVNSAAIFGDQGIEDSDLENWNRHLAINLTAPFVLSQAFARALQARKAEGRIVNILDWRAMRPSADHLPYTISKAALAALTRSLAVALAPRITVNGIAFGAILPPSGEEKDAQILKRVPAARWANLDEVGQTLLFLLRGPSYVTGEILYLDGGRHLL